jgi:hypothetical protein
MACHTILAASNTDEIEDGQTGFLIERALDASAITPILGRLGDLVEHKSDNYCE